MKKLCILLVLFGISLNAIQAQYVLKPVEPNEVCMEAWQNYHKADVLWKTGWGLFGAGAGMTLAGCIGWTCAPRAESYAFTRPGFIIMCIGGGAFLFSIPCLAIGQVRRKAAMTTYFDINCSPETCADIKINYKKADTLWKTGWGLFGAGMGLTLGGGLLWVSTSNWGGVEPGLRSASLDAMSLAGFWIMIAGSGITVASIPCLAVGQVRRKAAMNMYNERGCQQEQPLVQFSLQTSSNGLGLAMRF